MDRPPRQAAEPIVSWTRLWRMALTAAVMAAGTLAVLALSKPAHGTTYAATLAFTTFVLFQVMNAFNVRSEHESAFSRSPPANRWLFGSLTTVVGLQALAVYVPALQQVFDTVALEPVHWLTAAAVASLALLVGETDKLLHHHPPPNASEPKLTAVIARNAPDARRRPASETPMPQRRAEKAWSAEWRHD
jgi:Ca2+-transporting ATPase